MPRISTTPPLTGRLVCLCLTLLALSPAQAAEDPLAWRDTRDMTDLIRNIDTWLDARSDLSANALRPLIRFTDEMTARATLGQTSHATSGGRPRGFYDEEARTIWLVRPWDHRDPRDVSVLLHELVHHRQSGRHWTCEGAKEWPAYKLQRAWLADLGLEPNVNWIAVVLESGCTARDKHPD
jgi:hypothetical protein